MSKPFVLDAKLDLPAASRLAVELRSRLDADIVLDARDVTHFGALCLQVLLSAADSLRHAGHQLKIENVNDKALAQLWAMGVTPEIISGGAQ